MQLPLSDHLKPDLIEILEHIDPSKDVDCLTPTNYKKMLELELQDYIEPDKKHFTILPCTSLALDQMLKEYEISATGKEVIILGQSYLVGTPVASLFRRKGSKVLVSDTENCKHHLHFADILVSCTGTNVQIEAGEVKEGLVLFDIGILVDHSTGFVRGDVLPEKLFEKLSHFTPVPGGVGPLTVANVIHNLYGSFLKQNGVQDFDKSFEI